MNDLLQTPPRRAPRTWCLLGRKAGDNAQVMALAGALGWPWEERHIVAHPWELLPHLALGVTLAGIDRGASSRLEPPWPELVLTAGRRNEPVARWLRRQSGGATRLVHLGRPWAPPGSWDLVVTTPQYFLPAAPNIRHNTLPLCDLGAEALAAAGEALAPQLASLPRPWIAVLVGGDSGKYVYTAAKGQRLGALAERLAATNEGSLLVMGSPRTPPAALDALAGELRRPGLVHHWGEGQNPYRGALALADAFVVSGESMSMLAEAQTRGRPVYIFDPGDGATPWWRLPHGWRYKPLSHRLAMRFAPQRMRRDIGCIQAALVASGAAQWLDEASASAPLPAAVAANDGVCAAELAASAAAVRALFQGG
ncbi:mitochondrial fission ELM1 family protein [Pseudohaliea rubra]|uniref:Domain protein-containing protein n=1 Tax=Pseudohaliea rubra DSM 19751 TaxID=1265313 RepID=A0A095XWB7_9GAMM|nr:ELM1/GtrOC1 family putative glycosyltransferase [Pseudohaliea rubra]KGE03986.1 domain protein-containing protein [Pseudohaliea rubra DSM 19751]